MGNPVSATACCSPGAATGPCPLTPNIQCTGAFTAGCDGINSICTTVVQTAFITGRPGKCSATQPCCVPNASNNDPRTTSVGAWLYPDPNNTCPAQATCGDIDIDQCITIGGNTPQICAGVTGGNISTNISTTVPITCKWDAGTFRSLENVKTWINKYDQTDPAVIKVYNTQIMPTLCSTPQANACPPSNTEGPWKSDICSPYVATNETGSFCRSWLSGLSNDNDIVETVNSRSINGYCEYILNEATRNPDEGLNNGEVNECLCINRGKDPNGPFIQTKDALIKAGIKNVNDLGQVGCWYAACNSESTTQLVPLKSNTTQPIYYPTNCPSVCSNINNITGTLTNNTFTTNINCSGSTPSTPNQGGSDDGTVKSFWEKYKWFIIGGGILLIIIIIVIFIIFILFEEEKKK